MTASANSLATALEPTSEVRPRYLTARKPAVSPRKLEQRDLVIALLREHAPVSQVQLGAHIGLAQSLVGELLSGAKPLAFEAVFLMPTRMGLDIVEAAQDILRARLRDEKRAERDSVAVHAEQVVAPKPRRNM